ncbi:hypothetical protein Cgig2_025476 [Carnegiea gigantea]|uniref:Rab-GAP TBC domain-containing protein n=1 Tax=Carnegiea gigantea TaxID=171969 RepID=A0A9Q1K681_9CARY|nr:hypothetical protein Cgig2_025476 [Carnegiea gigantea]
MMPFAAITPEMPHSLPGPSLTSRFAHLRSVRWRIDLGVLPSSLFSTIDDLRRVTADSRRRYAHLRKCLLIDPHVPKVDDDTSNLAMDNPLSGRLKCSRASTWGRFFRNAELEQMVNKDLSRLYPEHESYFQTPGCQVLLRRILLLWCLRHPECGYRQGMHELLAPLLYVLHADIQYLNEVHGLYEDHFVDKFDEVLFNEGPDFNFKISSRTLEDEIGSQKQSRKHSNLSDLDPNVQTIVLLNDPYGAEGELGIVLSEKFMEHDAYSMFDALMSGAGGVVAMAGFFSHSSASATQTGLAPVIEASLAVYHLLSVVDSSLYSHLVELGVEPQYFALRWLRVLFGREFSLEELLVIWDEIFSFENSPSVKAPEDDSSGVLNSPRGAFITAMAVSMMLNLRSSLLATEHATTCLQRLLNFPENVELDKLIEKAKSLVSLVLDSNVPFHSTPVIGDVNRTKESSENGHIKSLLFDSASPRTPMSPLPERYWEEKWRVLHEEEETKKGSSSRKSSQKCWTEKLKLKLSWNESDSSPPKRGSRDRDNDSSLRRSLLEDLPGQLSSSEEIEEPEHDKSSVFAEPASSVEHDSEKNSTILNLSPDVMEDGTKTTSSSWSTMEESPLPISVPPDMDTFAGFGTDNYLGEGIVTLSKEQRTSSGRFPWFWKLGRQSSGEGTSDRRPEVENGKSVDDGSLQADKVGFSAENTNCNPVNLKTNGCDQNLICTLRNLGQSMLENIQRNAYEVLGMLVKWTGVYFPIVNVDVGSGIQSKRLSSLQEKSQAGSLDHLSKHALVGKGQVTAMAALKELRKISSLLQEM